MIGKWGGEAIMLGVAFDCIPLVINGLKVVHFEGVVCSLGGVLAAVCLVLFVSIAFASRCRSGVWR